MRRGYSHCLDSVRTLSPLIHTAYETRGLLCIFTPPCSLLARAPARTSHMRDNGFFTSSLQCMYVGMALRLRVPYTNSIAVYIHSGAISGLILSRASAARSLKKNSKHTAAEGARQLGPIQFSQLLDCKHMRLLFVVFT